MFKFNFSQHKIPFIRFLVFASLILVNPVAIAHHVLDNQIPTNFVEGFLSGLGHPIIGLDHFAFVVASGLIAAGKLTNISIPISFVIATIVGVVFHLFSFDLPIGEIVVAASVVVFGIMLATKNQLTIFENKSDSIFNFIPVIIAVFAGIFHGYAYGESIVGAEMSPLSAYLLGLTIIQLLIAIVAFFIGNLINKQLTRNVYLINLFLGIAIATIGGVFLFDSLL